MVGVSDLRDMKFKDVLIVIFLSGLLLYAACHRAGWVGKERLTVDNQRNFDRLAEVCDTVQYENWIFYVHPEAGLTVSTKSGEVLHHLPEYRSGEIELIATPDTSGTFHGLVYIRSECGISSPCFRICPEGKLEIASI